MTTTQWEKDLFQGRKKVSAGRVKLNCIQSILKRELPVIRSQ